MSAIIHLMGRVTKDPAMQQGRNNGTEYISLDLATSQRSQNAQNNPENPYESVFYQCYLNKHLAERLLKAGVRKGTCLYIYGELELHPFVYSQGQRSGQAGSGAKINVRDWQFCLSNKPEGETGGNQAGAPPYNGGAYPANGNVAGNGNYPGGGNPSGGGSYPNVGNGNANGNYSNAGNGNAGANYPNNRNGAAGTSYSNGGSNMGNGSQPANGGTPQGGSYQANAPAQNGSAGNQMYQQQKGNAQYGQTPPQGGFAGDGFTNIPEGMASQLPFTA